MDQNLKLGQCLEKRGTQGNLNLFPFSGAVDSNRTLVILFMKHYSLCFFHVGLILVSFQYQMLRDSKNTFH